MQSTCPNCKIKLFPTPPIYYFISLVQFLIHSIILSIIHPFTYSFIHPFTYSFTHPFRYSFIPPFIQSIHSLIHPFWDCYPLKICSLQFWENSSISQSVQCFRSIRWIYIIPVFLCWSYPRCYSELSSLICKVPRLLQGWQLYPCIYWSPKKTIFTPL